MPSANLEYFRARALKERERAAACVDPDLRAVHLDFARRYEAAAGHAVAESQLQTSRAIIRQSRQLLETNVPMPPF